MLKIHLTNQQIIQQGLGWGFQATLKGGVVFALLQVVITLLQIVFLMATNQLNFADLFWYIPGLGFAFWVALLVSWLLTSLPNMVGAVLLLWGLQKGAQSKPVSIQNIVVLGGGLGVFITFLLMAGLSYPIAFFWGRLGDDLLLWRLGVALVAGGYTGGKVASQFTDQMIQKQVIVLTTLADDSVHFTAETPL